VTLPRLGALGLVVLAVVAVLYVTPSDDYLFLPVAAQPLAPKVQVQGERPDRNGGGIYYDEVHIRKASILESHFPGLASGSTLVPGDVYLPKGTSEKQQFQVDLQDMERSQKIAAAVALRSAGYKVKIVPSGAIVTATYPNTPAAKALRPGDVVVAVDGTPVTTPDALGRRIRAHKPGSTVALRVRRGGKVVPVRVRTISDPEQKRTIVGVAIAPNVKITLPLKVSIDLGRVGGPSAGLAFALDILEELGKDVDHGLKVAATGEIGLDGRVGPIGGVKQKTLGAKKAGVDVFLVPAGDNAREARRYAGDLRIIPVESFRQALRALATAAKTQQKG
jgi:PDZ domain-containing protein